MDAFYEMFNIVVLFVALLIPGYVLGKANLVEGSTMVSFSNILMYVAMPALVLCKLISMDMSDVGAWEIVIAAALPALLVLVLSALSRILPMSDVARERALRFCSVFPNCGFMGIPLAAAMWPDQPKIVLYVSIFNVVNTFLILTVGVYALSGEKKQINVKKTLISPIFFAIVVGVICAAFGLGEKMTFLGNYSNLLAQLTTPLSMLAAGYELSNLHLLKMWKNWGIYFSSLLKLVVSPLIALGVLSLCRFVFGISICREMAMAMLVASSVSAAASGPSMAKKYGADSEYAATLTLSGTLLCVVTMPLMYLLFDLVF